MSSQKQSYLITVKTLSGDVYTFSSGNGKDIQYDAKYDTINHLKTLLSNQLNVDQKLIKLFTEEEELKNNFVTDQNGWKTMTETPLPEKNITLFVFVESSEYRVKIEYYGKNSKNGKDYEDIRHSLWENNEFEQKFDFIFCPPLSKMFVILNITLTDTEGNDFKLLFLKQTEGENLYEYENEFIYLVHYGYSHSPPSNINIKPVWTFSQITSCFDKILYPVLELNHIPYEIIEEFRKTLYNRKENLMKMMIKKPMALDQVKEMIKNDSLDLMNSYMDMLMESTYDTKEKEQRALDIFHYLKSLGVEVKNNDNTKFKFKIIL
jgi:hypothetical protein